MTSFDPDASHSALLYLIYHHLKENGYKKAANVLKKHVTQIETPEEITSLHDIYTSWIKVSEIGQNAKQEPEVDSTTLKKIKDDPATKEEVVDLKPIDNLPAGPQTLQAADAETPRSATSECEKESPTKAVNDAAPTKTPVTTTPSKAESSDSDDSDRDDSDSEHEKPAPKAASGRPSPQALVKATPAKAAPQTTRRKAQGSDSDRSCSEEEAPVKKPVATAPVKPVATAPVKPVATAPVKPVATAPVKPVATAPVKAVSVKSTPVKETSKPADSSDSESEDADSEEESPVKVNHTIRISALTPRPGSVKVAKATPVKPSGVTPSQTKAAPLTPAAGKKAQSSDSDSSDEEEEAPEKAKTKPAATPGIKTVAVTTPLPVKSNRPAVTASKPAESSDSDSSEDEIPLAQITGKVTEASAPTKTPVTTTPSKAESSDSDDSDREHERSVLTTKAGSVKATKGTPVKPRVILSQTKSAPITPVAGKKAQSSESDSSDSETDLKVSKKAKTKPVATPGIKTVAVTTPLPVKSNRPAVTASKPAESSDSDSSEDEIPLAQITGKVTEASAPTKTPVTTTPSKAESSDSDDSDREHEKSVMTPRPGSVKAAKATPVKPSGVTPSQTKSAPMTPAARKKAQSSDSDSSDEEEAPVKQKTTLTKTTPKASDAAVKRENDRSDSSDSEDDAPDEQAPTIPTPRLAKAPPTAPAAAEKANRSDSSESDTEEDTPAKKAKPKLGASVPVNLVAVTTPEPVKSNRPAVTVSKPAESSDSDSSEDEIPLAQKPESAPIKNVDTEAPISEEIAVTQAQATPPVRNVGGAEEEEDEANPVTPTTAQDDNADDSVDAESPSEVPEVDTPPSSVPESAKEEEETPDSPQKPLTTDAASEEHKAEDHIVTSTTSEDKTEAAGVPEEPSATAAVVGPVVEEEYIKGVEPLIASSPTENLEPEKVTIETVLETVPTEKPTTDSPATERKRCTETSDLTPSDKKMKKKKKKKNKEDAPANWEPTEEGDSAEVEPAVEEEYQEDVEPHISNLPPDNLEPEKVTIETVLEKRLYEKPTADTPASKRKRCTETTDSTPSDEKMKRKKRKKKKDVQENGQLPIQGDDESTVDAIPSSESNSTTLVLSVKSLKKTKKNKKKRKKTKREPMEKDEMTEVVPKKHGFEKSKKKTANNINAKEYLKATNKKRPLPPIHEPEELEIPKNKKKKVIESAVVKENTTPVIEKKKKKVDENTVKDSDISAPIPSLPHKRSQNKKKKSKLKEKKEKIKNALKRPKKASTGPVTCTPAKNTPGKKKKSTKEK
ncbi:nucleolar protein dao-5 [Esox lucius]|uniref:nucleolar protein dao-5 n=1 Tax=Esox lucius TaxID=8010 RepID=UPI001476F4E2|nr:nucleolar protein dao-5 [Esox lucius]